MFINQIKPNIFAEILGLTPKYRTCFPFSEGIGLTVVKIQQGDILLWLQLHLKHRHDDKPQSQISGVQIFFVVLVQMKETLETQETKPPPGLVKTF